MVFLFLICMDRMSYPKSKSFWITAITKANYCRQSHNRNALQFAYLKVLKLTRIDKAILTWGGVYAFQTGYFLGERGCYCWCYCCLHLELKSRISKIGFRTVISTMSWIMDRDNVSNFWCTDKLWQVIKKDMMHCPLCISGKHTRIFSPYV